MSGKGIFIEWDGYRGNIRQWSKRTGITEQTLLDRYYKGLKPPELFKPAKKQKENTLCWDCKNAVPSSCYGCSWSRDFKPVKGWEAEPRVQIVSHGYGCFHKNMSYYIKQCPEFTPD